MRRIKNDPGWPFENGGCLKEKQLFSILFLKRRAELEELMKDEREDVDLDSLRHLYRQYLSENVLGLSDREKDFLNSLETYDEKGGLLSFLMDMTDWVICIGSLCTNENYSGVEASVDGKVFKKLDFLTPKDREEEERLIRVRTIRETGRELTLMNPEIVSDGFHALRPFAGDWGMRSVGKNGGKNEKHRL